MRATERPRLAVTRIEAWSGEQFSARVHECMHIYVRAMHYPDSAGVHRAVSARKHINNEGFACRAALTEDGTLLGFGYGYTTRPGQWWHDLVRRSLDRDTARDWLHDAFELSELHVLPSAQRQGIGQRLLGSLADGIPHANLLLSTPDSDTRAFRMYRQQGFVDLTRNYLFPGDNRPFAVLGARLPLADGR